MKNVENTYIIALAPEKSDIYLNTDIIILSGCASVYEDKINSISKNSIILKGCPKYDMTAFIDKLSLIFKNNNIKSIRIVRFISPCCTVFEKAVKTSIEISRREIPFSVIKISPLNEITE